MLNLRSVNGKKFTLTTRTCYDCHFFARRKDVVSVLKQALIPTDFLPSFVIRRRPSIVGIVRNVVPSLHVVAYISNGKIHLGCHVFGRKSSKKILKWAGVEK